LLYTSKLDISASRLNKFSADRQTLVYGSSLSPDTKKVVILSMCYTAKFLAIQSGSTGSVVGTISTCTYIIIF
jgi:hypothetical protein